MNDFPFGEGMPSHKNGSTGTPFSPVEYFDQRSASTPTITVGAGLKRPQGRRIKLNEFSPQALKSVLDAQSMALDGWWSAHIWSDNYRAAKNWEAAIGVMIDVDYQVATEDGHRKVILPPEWQEQLTSFALAGRFLAQLFHITKHGFRLVFMFSELVENAQYFKRIARAAMNLAQLDINALELPVSGFGQPGFAVDPISDDLARLMRRPRCYRESEGNRPESIAAPLLVVRETPMSSSTILELSGIGPEIVVTNSSVIEDEDIFEELNDSSVGPDFPKEVLPPMIVDLMQGVATGCGVSFEMTLSAAFALFCQAIGEHIKVKVGPIIGSPLLWFANIAPSGSAKSPIARYFLAPIKERERVLKKIYDVDYADYKAKLAKRKSAKGKTDDSPINVPARRRAYLTEATTEGLLQDLGNSDEPILYHVDEFPILLGSADGYGKSGSNLGRSRLLSLWGREMIAPSRRHNQEPLCDNPFLIIVAGAQPSVMRTLQLSRNDGLAARFLFVQPKPCFGGLGQELNEAIPPEIESLYMRLSTIPSKTYRLSKDSYKLLEAKAKSWKRKAYDLDQANWGLLSAAYGKAPLHVVRIMALLTALWSVSGNPYESNNGEVTSRKLERDAIKFLEFFLAHSQKCFQLISSLEDPEKAARKIRYLDQHIITGLRKLRPNGETRGTSEWAKLLESVGADKVGPRQLGKALVRIAELNLPDLSVSRPESRSSSKKQWTIRMLRQTETAQTA